MIKKTSEELITQKEKNLTNINKVSAPMEANQPIDVNVEKILKKDGFSNITFITQGWSSDAYNAVFDGKDYIIRTSKIGSSGFDSYKKEHDILEIIANKIKSVKVPRTRICESDSLNYVAHEKIIGNSFEIKSFESLSETEQDNFSRSVANFFNELHSIDINEFSNISGMYWKKIDTNCLRNDFEKYLQFLRNDGLEETLSCSACEIDAFCKFVDSFPNNKEPEVLLHRDLYEKNYVVDNQMRLIGVFDFGNCSIDKRAIEFSCFVERNDDGTFKKPLLLKKILFFYEQASGIHISFNDVANQLRLSDAYDFSWLVSTLDNNKDHLIECVKRIKKWLVHYM